MAITAREFDKTADGRPVTAYRIKNPEGLRAEIIDFGAILRKLEVPDKAGRYEDIVLGCDNIADYGKGPHFGGTIGRYGNRIKNGKFVLDGKTYQLLLNDGQHHLHGGEFGFDRVLWQAGNWDPAGNSLELLYNSPDGEEGYPGNLSVRVTYTLTADGIGIHYEAKTDKDTIVNLTNHSYFNLNGQGKGNIDGHWVKILADSYTLADDELIPTGEIASVAGTPYDFRRGKTIAQGMDEGKAFSTMQLPCYNGGYDTNFVLKKGESLGLAAEVYEQESGRVMEVLTDQPGVQLYTGNMMMDEWGKDGVRYNVRGGLCLETQHYPDSPNHPEWPSVVLRPGKEYDSATIYRFSIR